MFGIHTNQDSYFPEEEILIDQVLVIQSLARDLESKQTEMNDAVTRLKGALNNFYLTASDTVSP